MGNVSYRFFTCLFNAFLIWVLLINFLGWSGGAINLTGIDNYNDWSTSYFGFESLFGAVKHYDYLVNLVPFFSWKEFPTHLDWLIDTICFGIPSLHDALFNGNWGDGLAALYHFATIMFQPIMLGIHLTIVLGHIVNILFALVQVFLMCLTGAFNVPFANMPSPTDYNVVQTIVDEVHFAFAPML